MKKKIILWSIWAALYVICVPFGYVNEPTATQALGMLLLGLIFFIPGAILLIDALRNEDKKTLLILRWVSGCSLGLTLIFLVANVFSALGSASLGDTLYGFLALVSVPMLCCRQWALSLLLWAIIFFATIIRKPKALDK